MKAKLLVVLGLLTCLAAVVWSHLSDEPTEERPIAVAPKRPDAMPTTPSGTNVSSATSKDTSASSSSLQASDGDTSASRASYERAEDLLALVEILDASASHDANAALAIGLAYKECEIVGAARGKGNLDQLFTRNLDKYPETIPFTKAAITRLKARCSKLATVRNLKVGDHGKYIEQAARLGSREAIAMRLPEVFKTAGIAAVRSQVRDLLRSGDPAALLAMNDFVSASSELIFAHGSMLHNLRSDSFALMLAACRLGLDCGAQGHLMYQSCLANMPCNYGSFYEQLQAVWLPTVSFRRQMELADRIVVSIERGGVTDDNFGP
jgi:hypothetical protein